MGSGLKPLTDDKKNVIKILCCYCGKDDLVKKGRSGNGKQRYR